MLARLLSLLVALLLAAEVLAVGRGREMPPGNKVS